ncbi:DUF86 domain-containing protein [Candidatus Chloroploca sp. Khr17]|uniref:HepT-like ribonuclease domain-containing protein n=1 Tax=Candidatus Chloroploca sp. Khr17 TaxID=2496869 RepID=UPI00101D9BFC|nr:HepT-like ribonuclease domain-containing protein [Candidatus Chloroploca sp. Khr17]
MSDDTIYLQPILACISRIERHVAGGREAFLASDLLQDATLRNLQTLSEATQRLSAADKATQPQIPWAQIAAFRNVLVHVYLSIDLEQIWIVIHHDIPPLKQAVRALLDAQP